MADDRRRDSGFEILGVVVLLALILLLCALKIICPSGECSSGLVKCQNCEGGCCLPDGTCPCPTGSSPCKDVCPSSLNCPSGCCDPSTCQCTIVPECPPGSQWSSERGCCVALEGVRRGECITVCATDSSRVGGCTAGLDACDANSCCPSGSVGWSSDQKCCIDSSGVCMQLCTLDPFRLFCPRPNTGGCDSGGCCPYGAHWDTVKSCCATQVGDCVCTNDDICKTCNLTNHLCGGIGPRLCPSGSPDCLGSTCSNGQCDGSGTSGGACFNSDQCKVCNLTNHLCGGIGPRLCPNGNSDCLGSTCSNGQCDGSSGGTGDGTTSLVACNYDSMSLSTCPSSIICTGKCANQGSKCIDPRQPPGICNSSGSCSSSVDCCCGLNCQFIPGEGNVCCSGGLFVCYSGQ